MKNEADRDARPFLDAATALEPRGTGRSTGRKSGADFNPARCHCRTPAAAGFSWLQLGLVLLVFLAETLTARGQISIRTLGGGRLTPTGKDAGYVDGNPLQDSQFFSPFGLAVDLTGNLFVADRDNGAVRKLDVAANRVSTLLAGLDRPVAVAVNPLNEILILTQGDGRLRKIDRFGNVLIHEITLSTPTALAIDAENRVYVSESSGTVVRVEFGKAIRAVLRAGLSSPGGLAVLNSGLIAVSEIGHHRLLFLNPENGETVLQVGAGTAGFRNGSLTSARFNQPHHLARSPDGGLLVADRANHRVRRVTPDGTVSTLYGIDPAAWEGPECLTCSPVILPGWFDSSAEFAEARDPVGVAVSAEGKVFTTELFYHLVREVSGTALVFGPGADVTGTNVVALPPTFSPNMGYYPMGHEITVFNPNTNAFFSNTIFFTTDGSDPSTNSTRLIMQKGVGTIRWREPQRDLTSLRVLAFVGPRASEVVQGKPPVENQIGVTRDLVAAPGATLAIPVTVSLRPQDRLKSLQFRVEITPDDPAGIPIPSRFRALSTATNDFITLVTTTEQEGVATFRSLAYTNGLARGLAIAFVGADANLSVRNFAVVAMLAVPIPPSARLGDHYTIQVLNPSATPDAGDTPLALSAMPPRRITVARTAFLAGDSSPVTWYNAEGLASAGSGPVAELPDPGLGFGDRQLGNSDVNNAFGASMGLRVPFEFTDLFDAMDVFPEDSAAGAGGDGLIRFLDWQVLLNRSLGLDPSRWLRVRGENGARTARALRESEPPLANSPAPTLAQALPGLVWHRHAVLSAASQERVSPGATIDWPVYVLVGAGYRVAGLAFRATVEQEGNAPAVTEPLKFVSARGLVAPIHGASPAPNVLLLGWPIVPSHSFEPPLQGSNLVGYVRFRVPPNAQPGQAYRLQFANADGAPDLRTQYDFETRPAMVWVQSAPLRPDEIISDEWKVRFFGSLTNHLAAAAADPDEDGFSNQQEYLAGTHPASAQSQLMLEAPRYDPVLPSVVLRWLSAPGKSYALEARSTLISDSWTTLASGLAGTGGYQEFRDAPPSRAARYYRLRLDP